ncbi:MAG: sugar phosphate isomerase/epimerase [Devosia sp.]
MRRYRYSFQLFSARSFPPLETQIETLAELGYDAVEPYAAIYRENLKGLRAACDANGLTIPSCHMPIADFDADLSQVIDAAKFMGCELLISGALPKELRIQPADGWQALGARLSEYAAALEKEGIKLAWHNHEWEYVAYPDGSRPIDHLLACPGIHFEPDMGWIAWANTDIATELDRYADKIAAFHFRDVAPAGTAEESGWGDIGRGIIDWKGLWPTIAKVDNDLLVFEHENPTDWVRFARDSRNFILDVIASQDR